MHPTPSRQTQRYYHMISFIVIQDDNKASRCSAVQCHVMNFLVDEENLQCQNPVTVTCHSEVRWSLTIQVRTFLGRSDICACWYYSAYYHW
jgi:hypothetical protein